MSQKNTRKPAPARGRRRATGAIALAALATLWLSTAVAAPDWMRGVEEAMEPQNLTRPSGISEEQAANLVRRRTGGRVLATDRAEHGGRRGYDVRVLVDGKRVKNLFVDDEGRIRSRD